jgi:hypothetical protein
MLAAYEIIYQGRVLRGSDRGWFLREGRGVLVSGLLTVPYVAGKLMGAGSLVENPAYRLTISPGRYLDTFHLYLNPLLYQEHVFRDSNTIQLLLGMLVLGLWRRSRPLLFAWCFLLVSLLPVAFIAHYSGFFLYLPMAGWSLYAAVLLVMARRFVSRRLLAERLQVASVVALPVLLAMFLAPHHRHQSAKTLRIFESVQSPSRQFASEMIALRPSLPHGARVLFVGGPFARDEYFLLFLTRLLYRDMSITVEKTTPGEGYDAVFGFQHGHLRDCRAGCSQDWRKLLISGTREASSVRRGRAPYEIMR